MPVRKAKAKVKALPFVTLLEAGVIFAVFSLILGTIFLVLAP